jgi:hypothetical protein
MAKDQSPGSDAPAHDEDWVEVGQAPARAPRSEGPSAAAPVEFEQPRAYQDKPSNQPWKYSVYTGAAGLILMLAVYVFPEWRTFETPWDSSFLTAYALLPFPVLALIWGLIGIVGKQYRADLARSAVGVVLSIAGFAVVFSDVLSDTTAVPPQELPKDRIDMSPEELQEWRSRKLRQ